MLKVVERTPAGEESGELLPLDEIARVGARRMLMAALATEAADYVERHRDERDDEGRALVVHNGRAKARKLTLGAGTVELKVPRVNDRRAGCLEGVLLIYAVRVTNASMGCVRNFVFESVVID